MEQEELPKLARGERLKTQYDCGPFYRIKVPHGWLVAYKESMVYVPDENHEWLAE